MALQRKANATFFACLFLIGTFQEMCEAAEWSASPSIQLREDYDDNILLSTQSHQTVTSIWVTPKLDFGVASDNWQVSGGAALTRREFPGHSDLNTDAQNFTLGSSYKTERNILQLNASSVKTTYLAGATISSETGLFTQNTGSDMNTVSPSWTWLMTESNQLQLTYSLSDTSYVNAGSGIFDYRSSTVSGKFSNKYDAYTQIFLEYDYSIFRVPATNLESKTKSYQVGVTRSFSETMSATFSIGESSSLNQQQDVATCALSFGSTCLIPGPQTTASNRNSSSIFNASLDKQLELLHVTAAVSRSFSPSAAGHLERTDSASLSVSRPFTEKLTGNLVASGYKVSADTGSTANVDNRRSYQIQPSLGWQWTRECNLAMGYTYTHVQSIIETKPAISHAAYLTFAYQWPRISISR